MHDGKDEFQWVFEDFQPKIHRYLTRMVGEDEAEDLTQEVFTRVSRGIVDFRAEAQLSTWIYRIATNAAIDRLRSPSHRQSIRKDHFGQAEDREIEGMADQGAWTGEKTPTVEQALVRKQMNECIRAFIERLPENYRIVLILGELEGLKNKEIAEILDVTLNTVKIGLHRARQKLRVELATHCDSYWLEENEYAPDLQDVMQAIKAMNDE